MSCSLTHIEKHATPTKPVEVNDSHQREFKTPDDIRKYANANGTISASTMMDRLMLTFFGHKSTTENIDEDTLAEMFERLVTGWLDEIRSIVPRGQSIDDFVRAERKKILKVAQEGKKEQAEKLAVRLHDRIRTRKEVITLLGKYTFARLDRYYSHSPTFKQKKLRSRIVDTWNGIGILGGKTLGDVYKAK